MLNIRSIPVLSKLSLLVCLVIVLQACSDLKNEEQLLQSAKQYIQKGDLKAASIELRNTLQKNKKNAEARYLLGKLSMDAGHDKSALEAFSVAEVNGWDIEQIQFNRALLYVRMTQFQQVLDNIPDDSNWSNETRANILSLHAIALAGLKNNNQAKNTLEKAISLKPDATEVLKTTAIFQLSGLRDGDAKITIDRAIKLYPDNTDLLFIRAGIESKANNLSQASDTYKKIINLTSSNIITPNNRKAIIALANIQFSQKQYDDAKATLAKLIINNQDNIAHYLSGLIDYNQKNFLSAENHIRKVLSETPDHRRALQLMGHIKFSNKEYEQASQYFKRYLKIVPDDIDIQKILTQTYIFLNQSENAQSLLNKLLILDGNDITTLNLQSTFLLSQGDNASAISSLLKAIKQEPDNVLLREQLIKAYITSDKTNKALNEISTLQSLSQNKKKLQQLTISAYSKAGNITKAIDIAKTMLKAEPTDVEILSTLGRLYALNNDNDNARKYFNQSLKHNYNILAATSLADLNKKEGRIDDARVLYKKLIDSNLGGTFPMLALSELAAHDKNVNKMLSWLEKARNSSDEEIKARLILADYYLKNNDAEQADIYIQEALKIAPEKPETLILHSKILASLKRYNEAVPPLKKLLQNYPDSIDAHFLIGKVFLQQNMLAKARKHLQTVLTLDKNHVQARILITQVELKDGHHLKGLDHAKLLQTARPDSSIGYILEGDVWILHKNYHRAYSSYLKAWQLQQTPKLVTKLFSAARLTTTFEEAIKPLKSWLSNNPKDASMHLYLAVAYQSVNQNNDAIKEYETTLTLEPNNVTALNNLAWLYSFSDINKAITMAEKAYRASPNNAGILDTYGWILVKNNQAKNGLKLIKQALDREPKILDIQYHYAVALVKAGNKNQGKKLLSQLLSNTNEFKDREEAQQLLNKL